MSGFSIPSQFIDFAREITIGFFKSCSEPSRLASRDMPHNLAVEKRVAARTVRAVLSACRFPARVQPGYSGLRLRVYKNSALEMLRGVMNRDRLRIEIDPPLGEPVDDLRIYFKETLDRPGQASVRRKQDATVAVPDLYNLRHPPVQMVAVSECGIVAIIEPDNLAFHSRTPYRNIHRPCR